MCALKESVFPFNKLPGAELLTWTRDEKHRGGYGDRQKLWAKLC